MTTISRSRPIASVIQTFIEAVRGAAVLFCSSRFYVVSASAFATEATLSAGRTGRPPLPRWNSPRMQTPSRPEKLNGISIPYSAPIPTLKALIASQDPRRWAAFVALGHSTDSAAVSVLLQAATADDWEVRRAACEALGCRARSDARGQPRRRAPPGSSPGGRADRLLRPGLHRTPGASAAGPRAPAPQELRDARHRGPRTREAVSHDLRNDHPQPRPIPPVEGRPRRRDRRSRTARRSARSEGRWRGRR